MSVLCDGPWKNPRFQQDAKVVRAVQLNSMLLANHYVIALRGSFTVIRWLEQQNPLWRKGLRLLSSLHCYLQKLAAMLALKMFAAQTHRVRAECCLELGTKSKERRGHSKACQLWTFFSGRKVKKAQFLDVAQPQRAHTALRWSFQ